MIIVVRVVTPCGVRWVVLFVFFEQKTAYGMRIRDWSSEVCSSDLVRIVAGARDDMSICLVEKAGETVNLSVGFQRSAQGACHHQPGIVPGLALEHPAPRISVSDAGLGEHIAMLDRETPCIDDREDIGFRVPHTAFMIQDMLPPRLWDRSGRCAAHLGERRPVVYALEVADRGLDVFAEIGRAHV